MEGGYGTVIGEVELKEGKNVEREEVAGYEMWNEGGTWGKVSQVEC